MQVERLSVTVEPDLGESVRESAARAGKSVSKWVGEAIRQKQRNEALRAALDEWHAEDGAPTEDDLDEAVAILRGDPPGHRVGW
jgi:predicted transcriptional regulator